MGHSVAHYVWLPALIAPLTLLTCSAALRFARLLAPFTGSFTHFTHSLVRQLKFMNICSRCKRVQQEETHVWRSLETRPQCFTSRHSQPVSRKAIKLAFSAQVRLRECPTLLWLWKALLTLKSTHLPTNWHKASWAKLRPKRSSDFTFQSSADDPG